MTREFCDRCGEEIPDGEVYYLAEAAFHPVRVMAHRTGLGVTEKVAHAFERWPAWCGRCAGEGIGFMRAQRGEWKHYSELGEEAR